jgi:cell division protein FtsI/penicillin-binding protein 2
LWHIEHGDLEDFNYIFSPPIHKVNFSNTATDYDVALQSIGQGFSDLTVMEMAVIAACAASSDGAFVSPGFEVGGQRKVVNEFIKPQSAEKLRALMKLVVQPGGTAAGAFAGKISAAGKTGTADRDVLVYDRNGKPAVDYTDSQGRPHFKFIGVTDSWFIGFAPADNPQIAFAVMVENGGQGARNAAPIAAKLIEKAQSLGYVRSATSALPSAKQKK